MSGHTTSEIRLRQRRPRVRWWGSLYTRTLALVAAGCLLLAAVTLVSNRQLEGWLTAYLLAGHQEQTEVTAQSLERMLLHDLDDLEVNLSRDLYPDPQAELLRSVRDGLLLANGVVLSKAGGKSIWAVPEELEQSLAVPWFEGLVTQAAREKRTLTGQFQALPATGPTLVISRPLGSEPSAVASITVPLEWAPFVGEHATRESSIRLVDSAGREFNTDSGFQAAPETIREQLIKAIVEHRSLSRPCPTCSLASRVGDTELVAFATMPTLELGVAMHQEVSATLAPVRELRRRLALWAAIVALLFALAAGSSALIIVSPVSRLSRFLGGPATAAGSVPLPRITRGTEFEVLTVTLDEWRRRLQTVVADRERGRERKLWLGRVLNATEEERHRLARDLHDSVAQDLAALRLRVERASGRVPSPMREELIEIEGQTRRVLEELQRATLDLRPAVLDELGFVPAVSWLLEGLERAGLKTNLAVEEAGIQIPPDRATHLFRIVQEALANVRQHAKADHIFVTVARDGENVVVVIEDDGKGIDASRTRPRADRGTGLGLVGIKERAELLGGSVQIESEAGEGTVIMVVVPWNPKEVTDDG